jgi:cytochrome P450
MTQDGLEFDIRNPPDDPWPALAALRDRAPVVRFDAANVTAVLGYDATRDAFAAPDTLSSRYNVKPDGDYSIVSSDPPEHTRQRTILNRVLTPQRVQALEPRIREIADDLVDALPASGPVDIVPTFALQLPVIVLAELLGIADADRVRFKRWSDEQLSQSLGGGTSELAREFKEWALQQIVARREVGGPDDDLIGRLALTEVDGERLSDWEAASTLVLLVVAGHETTTNAFGNTVRLLVEERGLLERAHADRALVAGIVEESLRLDPPVTALPRKARHDLTLGDESVVEGEIVLLHMGAANRDPAFAPDPTRCEPDRELPGPHLAFGFGIHHCLGAALARAELRIGIETLLDRLENLRGIPGQRVRQTPAYVFRGPSEYLIDYDHRENACAGT